MKFEGCGYHKICYIRIRKGKVKYSEPKEDVVIDRDEKGRILGIEFYNGLKDSQ